MGPLVTLGWGAGAVGLNTNLGCFDFGFWIEKTAVKPFQPEEKILSLAVLYWMNY
ncbi:MAG: hypothetical protein MUC60_03250 [Oscillatoria sp. Prado101]|nr:hypothetical protein [Oscillatoria sp. Prado101]